MAFEKQNNSPYSKLKLYPLSTILCPALPALTPTLPPLTIESGVDVALQSTWRLFDSQKPGTTVQPMAETL